MSRVRTFVWNFSQPSDDASGEDKDKGKDETKSTETGASKDTSAAEKKTITLTEEDLQKRIEESLKERLAREAKKAEASAKRVKEEAEIAALEQNQQFQQVVEKQKERISQLEAKEALLDQTIAERDKYKDALEAKLKSEKTGLPPHILALLDRLDPVEQIEYLVKNSSVLKGDNRSPAGGPPPSPAAGSQKPMTGDEQKTAADRQALFVRSRF